jgi:RNA polymerase subunit RPABC4/transcription elongation factor Spt4
MAVSVDMGGSKVSPSELLDRLESLEVEIPDGTTTTAYADFGREFNINAVAISLGLADVVYDPDRFPGVVYHPDDGDDVVVFFGSGVVFIEATDAGVHDIVDDLADQLVELGLLETGMGPDVDFETTPRTVPVPEGYHETSAGGGDACTNCGHELTGEENFCPDCGTEVRSGCPDCGYDLSGEENYCPDCGTPVTGD